MNDRHTADTITDDALDQLYAQLNELHQEIAAAGTALTDMARKRNEQMDRADRAEAALARVRALHQPQHDGSGFPDSQQCSTCSQDGGDGYQYLVPWPCPTIRALDQQPEPCDGRPCAGTGCSHEQAAAALTAHDEAAGLYTAPAPAATEATTGHVYLSTGCLHGHHDYCQNHTGHSGTKTPAQCKFCAAPCTCGCHQEQP